jgi:hypothetical protein
VESAETVVKLQLLAKLRGRKPANRYMQRDHGVECVYRNRKVGSSNFQFSQQTKAPAHLHGVEVQVSLVAA